MISNLFVLPLFAQSPHLSALDTSDLTNIVYYYLWDITIQGTSKIDLLFNNQETTNERRGLIKHFCDTFLNMRDDKKEGMIYFDYGGMRYDPRQSLFMYTLCTPLDATMRTDYADAFSFRYTNEWEEFSLVALLKEKVKPVSLWRLSDDDDCRPNGSMQACNFATLLMPMMKAIINDLSNIKLATLYGWKYENTTDMRQEAIKEFSQTYFGDPQAACRDGEKRYLYPDVLEGDQKHCSHPKTYQMMDETLKSAFALTKKTQLVDGEKVLNAVCKHPKANLFACGFMSRGMSFVDGDWNTYQNIMLNENLFYQLFSLYYRQQITSNAKYSPLTFKTYSDSAELAFEESDQIQRDSFLIADALQETNRLLLHNAVNYPIHVALSAYKEDIVAYRASLTRIFTPLHQLYYTLRNAQACQQ
jgi:hypothetical protein